MGYTFDISIFVLALFLVVLVFFVPRWPKIGVVVFPLMILIWKDIAINVCLFLGVDREDMMFALPFILSMLAFGLVLCLNRIWPHVKIADDSGK